MRARARNVRVNCAGVLLRTRNNEVIVPSDISPIMTVNCALGTCATRAEIIVGFAVNRGSAKLRSHVTGSARALTLKPPKVAPPFEQQSSTAWQIEFSLSFQPRSLSLPMFLSPRSLT